MSSVNLAMDRENRGLTLEEEKTAIEVRNWNLYYGNKQALKSIIAQGIKQYGANPSTVDLQFAVQAAADIKDPLQAITATLNYLEKRAKNSVDKADAAEQYLIEKKNLAGFEKQWTNRVEKPTAKGKSRTLPSGVVVIEED
jgi:hypothetical protein